MAIAEWILTFDDGPLRADVELDQLDTLTDDEWLDPLTRILATLADHAAGPIPSVFYLRGPGYPWAPGQEPSVDLFRRGVDRILERHHHPAIHCFAHDPTLWWNWPFRGPEIHADLNRCVEYFTPMLPSPFTAFRPPYGQGGLPGVAWAIEHHIRHHRWDVDTEDWLHHPDSGWLRQFQNDPAGHLAHIRRVLPGRMWFDALWPGANDILLHVSKRTADALPQIIDRMVEITEALTLDPRFIVPPDYLRP